MLRFFSKPSRFRFILTSIVLVIVFTIALGWFGQRLNSSISDTNNSFLKETSSHQAALFNTKLHDQMSVLESLATQFETVDFNNYNQLKAAIISLRDVGDFKQLTVADSSGACIANNNTYAANISKKQYFQTALHGEPTISNGIEVDSEGEDILALSVPIYHENIIVGVLTGTYDRSVLASLFSTTMFQGEGYTYVVDSAGKIIVKTENTNALSVEDNYLQFLDEAEFLSETTTAQIAEDFSKGNSHTIHYTYHDQERYASYYAIGLHDWYVVTTITDNVITAQTQDLVFIVIIFIIILLVLLITVFMVIVSNLQKQSDSLSQSESTTEDDLQHSVIFTYDFSKKEFDISGDTDFIFGEDYPLIGPIDTDYLYKHIHPDDVSTFRHFMDSLHQKELYSAFELRFICSDAVYYWFRINCTLVTDKDNLPAQLIGNIVSAESNPTEDVLLKKDSKLDCLTGLLDKTNLEIYVKSVLNSQNNIGTHALFVIDLDNFKQINDTWGHTYGNRILKDAASKISGIFSQNDFIGRLKSNRFVVFLNLQNLDPAKPAFDLITQKAVALQKSLYESYTRHGNTYIPISASIGIAIYDKDGNSYSTLLHHATAAMKKCKETGKNSYCFYTGTE